MSESEKPIAGSGWGSLPFRLSRLAGLLIGLGLGLSWWFVAGHNSPEPAVLGRYSLRVALLVGLVTVGLFGYCAILVWKWRDWPTWLAHWRANLPAGSFFVLLALGAFAFGWLLSYGRLWHAALADPVWLAGLVCVYVGFLLIIADQQPDDLSSSRGRSFFHPGAAVLAVWVIYLGAVIVVALVGRSDEGHGLWLLAGACALVVFIGWASNQPHILARALHYSRLAWNIIRAPWLIGLALTGYIFVVYGQSLHHALINIDDLIELAFIYQRGPWIGFFSFRPQAPQLFRPFFAATAWLYYSIFGINYSGYQAGLLLVQVLATALVFLLVYRLNRQTWVALLLALVFASHSYVSDQLGWAIDTAVITGIIAALVALLFFRPSFTWQWHLILVVLLILAPLTRENGLGISGAVLVWVVLGPLAGYLNRRQALQIFGETCLTILLYFVMRWQAIPHNAVVLYSESGFWTSLLTASQIQSLAPLAKAWFFIYSASANLIANIFPLFTVQGLIWPHLGLLIGVIAGITAGIWLLLLARAARPETGHSSLRRSPSLLVASSLFIAAGFASPYFIGYISNSNSTEIELAVHGVVSLGIIISVMQSRNWQVQHKSVAVFAAGLILAGSIVTFSYFRYRMRYVGLVGWLILLALALQYLTQFEWQKSLRKILVSLLFAMVIINTARVQSTLPLGYMQPENFNNRNFLCDPYVPSELAQQIVQFYRLNQETFRFCRAHPPSTVISPSGWLGPIPGPINFEIARSS